MNRVLGWLVLLGVLGGTAYCLFEASASDPPGDEEIYLVFAEQLPEAPDDEEAATSEMRSIRGWKVWVGNFPRYHRGLPHQIGERVDPSNPFRELRFFRKADTPGAMVRNVWLTITGHAP